ncbi:hypothetical protein [Aeromonas salmonicida]|uniref:hypothetical protein n=1 Tax=Aeromonas salmonicida TaxID=645 RepID=UPI0012D96772|nr:hypothetical protein [Aeromonas salmonicida]
MKRFTHDADLRGMVVLRSLGFQLVPFKLHRFRKQRPHKPDCMYRTCSAGVFLISPPDRPKRECCDRECQRAGLAPSRWYGYSSSIEDTG